jgi:hypothetical protein
MVVRRQAEKFDPSSILYLVREYAGVRSQSELIRARETELKKRLATIVEEYGEEDEKGHLWLVLPEATGGWQSLKRERRVRTGLDEDKAERILAAAGLTERCYKMEPVLDQDEIMAALYEGLLTEQQVDEMYPQTVSFAFVPVKSS